MTIKNKFMAQNIDPEKIAEVIRECAAKYILPRFKALQDSEVKAKSGPDDLVTVADIETEEALDRILTAMYPGTVVIGEESIAAGTRDLTLLQNKEGVVFVADPVDGTGNFVQGRDTFCVMLACVVNGVVEHGWIYEVMSDRMMIASRGQGVAVNGTPVHVADPVGLKDSEGFGNVAFFPRKIRAHAEGLRDQVQDLSTLRSSGIEYMRIAAGEKDFGIIAGRILPWDHLAGTLAVREAGGVVVKWDGTPYTPPDGSGGLVIASHEGLVRELNQAVIQKMVDEYKRSP